MTNNQKKKDVWIYTIAVFLQGVGSSMAMPYMNLYMTDYLMINAATVSTALLVAKSIDLIVSIVAGPVMEKVKFKNGKYRPWLKFIGIVGFISFALVYLDTNVLGLKSEALRASIVAIAYIGFGLVMSLLMICRGGVLQYMAGSDMGMRSDITAKSAQATAAGTIITSAITLPLVGIMGGIVGENWGYFVACTSYAVFYFIGAFMMSNLAKTYDAPPTAAAKKTVTVKEMVQSVAGNSQLLILMVAMAIFYIAMNVFTGIQAYYFRYVINDYGFMATSMTIKTTFAFVASLIIPSIGRKLGKKNAFIAGMILYAASNLGISFLGATSKWVFTFFTCTFTAGMYMFTAFGVNYYLDCGEYGYYKTGIDNRAVAMAMSNIPMKIGFAGGSAVGGYGLAFIGYEAGMEITEKFISDFMLIIGIIPAVLCLIAAAIFFFGYKIKDEDAAMYAKANIERDAQLAAAAQQQ
ncbi:MAG: hypothetical protein E7218_04455 [Anaerofustis stercorihominis]|nr:hypothetical protein [Anaerofustis stercorihominis]